MATSTLNLPIAAAQPSDGSVSNAAPALMVAKGTNAAPARFTLYAAFDATTDEHLWWTFTMPANYASAPIVQLLWAANSITAANVVWASSLGAITPADVDTYLEHAQATAASAATAVNTTEARRVIVTTLTLTSLDSVAANDLVTLVVYRDANHASDTCTVDAELLSVSLTYTTS